MNHPQHNNTSAAVVRVIGVAGLLLAFAGGCQSNSTRQYGENFSNHDVQCATERLMDAQAAAGARADAMLHRQHFDGETLNSLGQHKLDLMIADDHAITPLTVYLDFPEADAHDELRRQSVVLYLKERGLLDSQIKLENGINPDALTSAAPNLLRLSKTENPGANDAAAPGVGGPGAQTSAGMSH